MNLPGIDPRLMETLAGERDPLEVAREMSPCCIVDATKKYPPMMLAHGDADQLVPFEQCTVMYDALCAIGQEPMMLQVLGAPHEGGFWSRETFRHIQDFLDAHLLW